MPIHYNHALIGKKGLINAYRLEKEGIISGSTLHAVYHDRPIRTDTLLRILEYADCRLDDFLLPEKPDWKRKRKHFVLDFKSLERRGVISEVVSRYYRKNLPMSLSTLDSIASFYGIEINDLIKIETVSIRTGDGHLKKCRKMIYLIKY
ncbi:MAG: helix-turn-helix transcriptional regulator [Lachnospiraceae bacterium]|nr:helix-turn-helix transcriptional regulator [Lachnospiraceae bacterium]